MFDPFQPRRHSPLPPCSGHFKEPNSERDERWKEKHKKKKKKAAQTCRSDVTYGSHHRPGLPSVSAVVACWHPLVTAQDGNNPGQRNCDKTTLNPLRTRFQRWGRGGMVSGGCRSFRWRLQKTGARRLGGVQPGLVGLSFSSFSQQIHDCDPLPCFTSACNKLLM